MKSSPRAIHFIITVKGKRVDAYFEPNFPNGKEMLVKGNRRNLPARRFATQHFEFWTKGPGPISETGYRSHFVNGTKRRLGITDRNLRDCVIKVAETLAAEYKGATK